jgi:hypothetical protein
MPAVRLFHWRSGKAAPLIATLRSAGYEVVYHRETQAMGLVDYKVCSVDGVWSGMVFAVKKARS